MIMPLVCLLNLNNYNIQTSDLDSLEMKGWNSAHIFPMAANIQFIFYINSKETEYRCSCQGIAKRGKR